MHFELQFSVFDSEIPSLVIPVSEILKAKNCSTDEKADRERVLFSKCISIYSYYCGAQVAMMTRDFPSFCESIGNKGNVVFSCIRTEEGPQFICRVLTNEGERAIDCPLYLQVHR